MWGFNVALLPSLSIVNFYQFHFKLIPSMKKISREVIDYGCDVSETSLAVAKAESERHNMNFPLQIKSVYDLEQSVDHADTVLCCEVLEHLTEPEAALKKLISVTRKDLILSVPNEPIWHLLNMARGKYWHALGNTPGHFQHWTRQMFVDFVSPYAEIVAIKTPLPWTLIHCRPKTGRSS